MDLKIKDVADLLNVSETTIRRWLADGKIPAYRINHQYRFSRIEIENWVMSHKLNPVAENATSLNTSSKTILEAPKEPSRGTKQYSLYRALHKGRVLNGVKGKTKEEVIQNATRQIAQDLGVDHEVLTDLLLDREKLQPTSLNHGIGIPHTRDFLLGQSRNVVSIVFPEHPIAYGALDGLPVHTLFFLFAADDKEHLSHLAKIAHLVHQDGAIEFLQKRPSKEELLEFVKNWESRIVQNQKESS